MEIKSSADESEMTFSGWIPEDEFQPMEMDSSAREWFSCFSRINHRLGDDFPADEMESSARKSFSGSRWNWSFIK